MEKIVKNNDGKTEGLDIAIETLDHRLRLLIGVLYSNNLVSKNDLEYIEDSIKKFMKEEEDGKDSQI